MEMVSFNITSIFLFVLSFLLVLLYITKRKKRLPPGPWKLPLIGNLHQLVGQQQIHIALKELAAKYGPLMHLKLGERSAIVISSYQVLKDVVKISHSAFENRPDLLLSQTISYDRGDIAFAPYGDHWRKIRKICTSQLLSPKRVKSFYPLMEEEISSHLATSINSNNTTINLSKCLQSLACAIICRACVGMACEDPKSLILASQQIAALTGLFNISDLFPSLKFLDFITGSSKQKLRKAHAECDRLLEDIVTAHEESINNIDQKDLLHVLLRIRDEEIHNFHVPITRDSIKGVLSDVFLGGNDSTKVTVEWAMSELVKNPAIMKKVQAEVRENLKGKKIVDHSDIQNLKYLKLVVKETLRLHPSAPLGFPRESAEQYEFNGYIIPNKTIAIVNIWAMGRDPQYWHDPEKFEPERFNLVDNTNGIPFGVVPFGFGLRVCPGMLFGKTAVELILARLLFHFDWKLPNGMNFEELDMIEIFGARKNNLYVIASPYICDEAPQLSN